MNFQPELNFLKNLLVNLNLNTRIIEENYEMEPFDYGLRQLINPDIDYSKHFNELLSYCNSNAINHIMDEFSFQYTMIKLPITNTATYLLVGPYSLTSFSSNHQIKLAEKYHIPPECNQLLDYILQKVPIFISYNYLSTIFNTFGDIIFGSADHYTVNNSEYESKYLLTSFTDNAEEPKYSDVLFDTMQYMEERYRLENDLLHSVAHGQINKIEMQIATITPQLFEQRLSDPIRNYKNYAIVMNTLLRKAAESGAVHPLYVDQISSKYAHRIDNTNSVDALISIMREMPRKYALIVKNHSLKGYSTPVRKIMMNVYSNLVGDLSLKTQAKMLNINASYLSSLFKKETGFTLTEYVNSQRIQHAVFLLNSTDLQIQTIAQHCGYTDICYFTKTFKKIIGKTPTEYRSILLYQKQ